jgi:hypothetical protein
MSANDWVSYDFAVLRVVPEVHLGAFAPVGVVLHARTAGFLGLRVLTDRYVLRAIAPTVDAELVERSLRSCKAIADGFPDAGPLALAPPSERFHWLTAPRSDVIQSSPIHSGLAPDPERELEVLYGKYVRK